MPGNGNRLKWIETGYRIFADLGPIGICVNAMAKQVGLSRTSFYHHFGDVEEFVEVLLEHHEDIGAEYVAGLLNCRDYDPDLIELIIANREGFLFHRRLLMNRSIRKYAECAASLDEVSAELTFKLWSKQHGLDHLGDAALELYSDLSESWWMRIEPDSFDYETLKRLNYEITGDLLRVLESAHDHASANGRPRIRLDSESRHVGGGFSGSPSID